MTTPVSNNGTILSNMVGDSSETVNPVSTNGKLLKRVSQSVASHETWTFTLVNGTEVEKEVVTWTSQQ